MMQFVAQIVEDMATRKRRQVFEHADQVSHIDCSREICVFGKRKVEAAVV